MISQEEVSRIILDPNTWANTFNNPWTEYCMKYWKDSVSMGPLQISFNVQMFPLTINNN